VSRAAKISLTVLLALIGLTIFAIFGSGPGDGPENTGRFVLLVLVLPVLLLFSFIIALARGRYQALAVNALIAAAALATIYVSAGLILMRFYFG
jgi:hypothetical protein